MGATEDNKAAQALTTVAAMLGPIPVDQYPSARIASKAAALLEEFKAWQLKLYPYDKNGTPPQPKT